MTESNSGRLAWDHDAGCHIDELGRHMVTDDGGATWRFREDADPSHVERYESATPNPVIRSTHT